MQVQPLKASNILIDQINDLVKNGKFNELALKRIERESQNLLKSDAHGGYLVLGILASVRNNAEETRDYFQKSLALSYDDLTLVNYARSLSELQLYNESLSVYNEVLTLSNYTNTQYIYEAARAAARAGYITRAEQLIGRFAMLNPNTPPTNDLLDLLHRVELFKKSNLKDADIVAIHSLVEEVHTEFGVKALFTDLWLDQWGDSETLYQDISVDSAYSYDMMNRLIEKYTETDYPAISNGRYFVGFKAGS